MKSMRKKQKGYCSKQEKNYSMIVAKMLRTRILLLAKKRNLLEPSFSRISWVKNVCVLLCRILSNGHIEPRDEYTYQVRYKYHFYCSFLHSCIESKDSCKFS